MQPHNFGIANRSGTDAAIHLLQYLVEKHPHKIILSVDGVGAFDHIKRAGMFAHLLHDAALHGLLPFVRMWYGTQSEFRWRDDAGQPHPIFQGDGGEQRDALMPGLFCLAPHNALSDIKARLPQGAEIVA